MQQTKWLTCWFALSRVQPAGALSGSTRRDKCVKHAEPVTYSNLKILSLKGSVKNLLIVSSDQQFILFMLHLYFAWQCVFASVSIFVCLWCCIGMWRCYSFTHVQSSIGWYKYLPLPSSERWVSVSAAALWMVLLFRWKGFLLFVSAFCCLYLD